MLQMLMFPFEAESVAYVVCNHFGLDTSEYSFSYIASWSSGKNMKELRASMDTIRKTSADMIGQIEEKLRKDKIVGAETATSVHYNVGKEVRTAIEKIGGTMPEDLPTPEKSIQQIEKEQMQRLKNKAKKGKLMLDE